MIQELIIATQNKHKIGEIEPLLPPNIKLITLKDLEFNEDIPETGTTLAENALQKARFVYKKFGKNCFADDTGSKFLLCMVVRGFIQPGMQGKDVPLKITCEKCC